jgi:alpha-ketoglutarate-dependent taurine dioxygenase
MRNSDGTEALPFARPPKASERGAYGGAAGQWSPAVSDTMDIVSSNADEAAVEAMEAVTKLATEVPWSKDGDQRVIHPVIQVHPGNGRLALVAVPMFTHSFEGMDVAESHTLLGELMRTGVGGPRGARIYQHSWRRGDLVRAVAIAFRLREWRV